MSDIPWMLTASHTKELASMLQFPVGLRFATLKGRPRPVLLVKGPKEAILAAKLNRGFKIYIVPLVSSDNSTACLVSAFFDDADEPLALTTPLFDDKDSEALWEGLWGGPFDVHFFNELNQEMLAYTTKVTIPQTICHRRDETKLMPLSLSLARAMVELSSEFMASRTLGDDAEALTVCLLEPIFPENIFFLDVRPHLNQHHLSPGLRYTTLERKEPGYLQELDIIALLRRVFRPDQIFHGPLRVTDGEEIADVVVVTATRVLLIQAKDSPNTAKTSRNTLNRKRSTAIKRLAKAAGQAKGAVRYARSIQGGVRMRVGATDSQVSLDGRTLFSLLVVKELFSYDFGEYDPILLELAKTSGAPCAALDYPELVQYTAHLDGEDAFFNALHRVYNFAMTEGTFPRLRFGLV